ncbi:DUF6461 domain-containing protein [Rhodococcus sp. 008]|uniref:DUF6461 domain-containing protein n=1 Tax=Rhodococcus sp. 008 TaxID=1723645 RepID=UPI0012EA6766|nr:DUF6461 domain-containing protein [Rhodococcus sp. 008]
MTRDYQWIMNGLFVTYVKDSDPATVIEAMTVEALGAESGLTGVNERGWEESAIIGAASVEDWTIAIAPAAIAGASDELMRPLSLGREVVTHYRDVNGGPGSMSGMTGNARCTSIRCCIAAPGWTLCPRSG